MRGQATPGDFARAHPHLSKSGFELRVWTVVSLLFACNYCGSAAHPVNYCPALPDEIASRFAGTVDADRTALEGGDVVVLWTSQNRDEQTIFLGAADADQDERATVALTIDEAAHLGAQLSLAASVKRGQVR